MRKRSHSSPSILPPSSEHILISSFDKRVIYNGETQSLLLNFENLNIKSEEDVELMRLVIEKKLEPMKRRLESVYHPKDLSTSTTTTTTSSSSSLLALPSPPPPSLLLSKSSSLLSSSSSSSYSSTCSTLFPIPLTIDKAKVELSKDMKNRSKEMSSYTPGPFVHCYVCYSNIFIDESTMNYFNEHLIQYFIKNYYLSVTRYVGSDLYESARKLEQYLMYYKIPDAKMKPTQMINKRFMFSAIHSQPIDQTNSSHNTSVSDVIGQGTFAKVYRGIDTLNGQVVAIKVLNKQFVKALNMIPFLQREISILKKINHPHIVKLLDYVFDSIPLSQSNKRPQNMNINNGNNNDDNDITMNDKTMNDKAMNDNDKTMNDSTNINNNTNIMDYTNTIDINIDGNIQKINKKKNNNDDGDGENNNDDDDAFLKYSDTHTSFHQNLSCHYNIEKINGMDKSKQPQQQQQQQQEEQQQQQHYYLVFEYVPIMQMGIKDLDMSEPYGCSEDSYGNNCVANEDEVKRIFSQIVSALHHLHHKMHVAHRDLQEVNICLDAKRNVKIIDFGCADYFQVGVASKKSIVGNIMYIPPEILLGKAYVGPETDLWALGVLLFRCMTGYLPFISSKHTILGQFRFDIDLEYGISDTCKDLIKHLLHPDSHQRIQDIEQVKNHPWFNQSNFIST